MPPLLDSSCGKNTASLLHVQVQSGVITQKLNYGKLESSTSISSIDYMSRNLVKGALSRYSDGIQVGWPGIDSLQEQEIFLHSTASYPMGTECPFPGVTVVGASSSQLTSYLMHRARTVELYLHCPTRLHGLVLN
jgi:hypothetical protein